MKKVLKRYKSNAWPLIAYMKEFQVMCPKCNREATVKLLDVDEPKLLCPQCSFSQSQSDLVFYNVLVQKYCGTCGFKINIKIPKVKAPYKTISVTCKQCGVNHEEEPRNERVQVFYEYPGYISEHHFGLPLWFQCEVKGKILWAVNRKHLNDINDYVGSSLRERQFTNYTTMVEKLPAFITASQNRRAILQVISELLNK